jgi:trk system potassium uptake protein
MNMIERALPPAWAGRKLSELDEADHFRVVALTRGGTSRMADPTLVGQEGDVVHIVVHRDAITELEARLGDVESGH